MPIDYARRLTGTVRTKRENSHLGVGLAFVAGATNAGAYLAVSQYTSHMTGIVSSMADAVVLGQTEVFLTGVGSLCAFTLGAATTAVMVNFARRRGLSSAYALPLLVEAALLLIFGFLGARLQLVHSIFVPATVSLLSFMMGLQNAVITKISQSEIRTTHVTGIVTDIGIELGKYVYVNRHESSAAPRVMADRRRLKLLTMLLASFFSGGVLGAIGFRSIGYSATIPLAVVLLTLAAVPAFDDVRSALRDERGRGE
ncbi:YoaK family protein [Gemmatimonas sp.]|uniref:YoaK family protein n=1 Tax=Gemmatimonas sp. TaxID=1962908 RepID=UPI00398347B4